MQGGRIGTTELMLKKLILENWKSFQYAELEIDALTVLIGTNASGKSNVLDALEFLSRITQGKEFHQALAGNTQQAPLRGGVEWAALKPHTQFTLQVWIGSEQKEVDYVYKITIATQPQVVSLGESLEQRTYASDPNLAPTIQELFRTVAQGDDMQCFIVSKPRFSLRKTIAGLSKLYDFQFPDEMLNQAMQRVSETLKNILILDPMPSKMRDYSPLAETLLGDGSNIAGVLAALSPEQKATVETKLAYYVRQLPDRDVVKVWAETVGRLEQDAMLYCEEAWMPHQPTSTMDARGMSDGTLRFLAIVTALLTQPEGSQVVIEEVENGLHPSRAHLLLEMLLQIGNDRHIDVLVTTHNPAVLDELTPDLLSEVVVAYRNSESGASELIRLEDLENLPQIVGIGSLGRAATRGTIERSLHRDQLGVN